jgi:predicted phage terminase large subunit-like protein
MDSKALLSLFEELRKRNDERTAKLLWRARLASDLELFALYYFPHYCTYAFNEFHHDSFESIGFMETAIRRARGAPRGYAKSTLEALIKPIHDVCYELEHFIVIISNTQDQANQKLRDIRSEIFNNPRLVSDFGLHFKTRTPGETSYVLYAGGHSCMFTAYGSGVEIRGIRYGAKRPTKIVVDDGEHSEEVLNEALRAKFRDWFFQVVSQIGNEDTNIVMIGTVLHRESLLKELLSNPAYDGKLYKSIISWASNEKLWQEWRAIYTNLDDPERMARADAFYRKNEAAMLKGTKVLWPEKEPYLYLMKELVEKGKRAFMKEKQNEPIGGDQVLFDKFLWYHEEERGIVIEHNGHVIKWEELRDREGRWLNSYGVLDPCAGQTKAKVGKLSDYACALTGLKDNRGRLLVHDDWTKRASPTAQISRVFDLHSAHQYQKFGVETNLFRNLLMPNLVAERKRREAEAKKIIRLPFYDIENTDNKQERIYTLEPKVSHGWILFNRALSQEFKSQLEAYPHVDHDDCPDALEMLWGLVNNRYKASALSTDAFGGR